MTVMATLILPHVLYGCETSPLTRKEEQAGDIDLLPLIFPYVAYQFSAELLLDQ
jgi:hypothetical protein